MLNKVSDYIHSHQLLTTDELHLVAVSGGADSVALLLLLQRLGYHVEAAHCNFNLRGEESLRDEDFVRKLCKKSQIPFHVIHFETKEYASAHKVSIEMAARTLRYRYFNQLRQDLNAATVCIAHHRDDAVETLLMNLMRGTGIHGLTGIRPRNGYIVRPLLCVSREELLAWLHTIGQDYVTDSSNLVDDVLRNKIRLNLIPFMQQIWPSSTEGIAKTANYLAEAEKVFNHTLSTQLDNLICRESSADTLSVRISSLQQLPSQEYFLHEWLFPLGFNATQISQISAHLIGESGREFSSLTHSLVIDRETIVVEPIRQPMKSMKIPETGLYHYTKNLSFRFEQKDTVTISKSADCATLDAENICFPLTIRPIEAGDRFSPFGMEGSRLVSDYLTDKKLSLLQKRRQLVITDSPGRILWLVGLRTDHRFRITPQTKKVLQISRLPD